MTKTAWIFPGQGSQAVGMEADLPDTSIGQAKFAQAEEILGWSILEKCRGDEAELSQTLYTQPCLYVVESILADLLKEKGQQPDVVAGHSLGEYSALYAAGVFDFITGLRLVKRRAEFMSAAAGGKMAALMKFNREQLEGAIATMSDVVIANDNSAEQVVISGTPAAVDAILGQVKARRVVPLKVSGAFHSPLMTEATQQFKALLGAATFSEAKVPVLSNVNPVPATAATELKQRLIAQMTGNVRWREIMEQFPTVEVSLAVEVGPGKVLTGLLKRTYRDLSLRNVGSLADL